MEEDLQAARVLSGHPKEVGGKAVVMEDIPYLHPFYEASPEDDATEVEVVRQGLANFLDQVFGKDVPASIPYNVRSALLANFLRTWPESKQQYPKLTVHTQILDLLEYYGIRKECVEGFTNLLREHYYKLNLQSFSVEQILKGEEAGQKTMVETLLDN
eukprot:g25437.t1